MYMILEKQTCKHNVSSLNIFFSYEKGYPLFNLENIKIPENYHVDNDKCNHSIFCTQLTNRYMIEKLFKYKIKHIFMHLCYARYALNNMDMCSILFNSLKCAGSIQFKFNIMKTVQFTKVT